MAQVSRRHHYIPACYLKNFCGEDGQLYVFDKKTGKVWRTNPNDAFFEKDRNLTISRTTGEKHDWLEALYAQMDALGAPLLQKLVNSKKTEVPLTLVERFNLGLFIAVLFWRVPARHAEAEKIINTEGFETGFFNIFEKSTGKPAPTMIKQAILSDEGMRKAYKLALPFIPFYIDSTYENIMKWKFYYQDPGFNITGDNPIIQKETNSYKDILDEFIFPVASNRLIVCSDSIPAQDLSAEFTLDLDAAILHKSERFVCCRDENFLKAVVEYYDTFARFGKEEGLIGRVFSYPNPE